MRGGSELRFGGRRHFKISNDVDADGMTVLAVDMRADGTKGTPLLDGAVLADEEVIADARPAVIEVPLMDGLRRYVVVCTADVVYDEAVCEKTVLKCAEFQVRGANGYAGKHGRDVPRSLCDRGEEGECGGADANECQTAQKVSTIHGGSPDRYTFDG